MANNLQGWVVLPLTQIAKNEKFSIVDGPFGSDLKLSDYVENGEVPVLTTKNLNGKFNPQAVRYITKEKFEQLKRSKIVPGDILIAKIGSVGKCSIYPGDAPVAIIPANLCKISVNEQIVNRSFLLYQFKSQEFQNKIAEITSATAQPAFSVKRLKTLSAKNPPLSEQRRIVAKLEKLLAKVDACKKRLEKIPAILKRFRQSVLAAACCGQLTGGWRKETLDFETLAKKEKETNFTAEHALTLPSVPQTWNWLRLEELCSKNRSLTYGVIKLGAPHHGGIPTLRSSDVRWLNVNLSNVKKIAPEIADEYGRTLL